MKTLQRIRFRPIVLAALMTIVAVHSRAQDTQPSSGWTQKRAVEGKREMVAAAHPLAVEAGYRKPHPEFFSFALRKCGLKKDELLFVGNQLNTDIQGALDYGIPNAWLSGKAFRSPDDTYSPGQIKPTYEIAGLGALPDLLKKIL